MLTATHNGKRLYLDPHSGTCVDCSLNLVQKPKNLDWQLACIWPREVKLFLDRKAMEWFGLV